MHSVYCKLIFFFLSLTDPSDHLPNHSGSPQFGSISGSKKKSDKSSSSSGRSGSTIHQSSLTGRMSQGR